MILSKRITQGAKLELIIPFKGKILSGETNGFYSSPDGAGGQMAVTQFESMNARMAIPCFDEPRFKGCLSFLENPHFGFIGWHILGFMYFWFPVTRNE